MGDRANVYVKDSYAEHGVFLYTHWGGYELPETLAAALKRGENRWDDGPYLTRIIFCEMVRGDVEGETGYGISTLIPDNEHPILVVDVREQMVGLSEASVPPVVYRSIPIREFVDNPSSLCGEDDDR